MMHPASTTTSGIEPLVEAETEGRHTMATRIWTEDEIRELVQTNDVVLYRALRKLYECQTAAKHYEEELRPYDEKRRPQVCR